MIKRTIQKQPFDMALEVINFGMLVAMAAYTALMYQELPKTIATHFDLHGVANGYGNRSSLAILVMVGFVMWLMFTLLLKIPHHWNYIVKITEENAERQYAMGMTFMRIMCFQILGMFAFLQWDIIQGALTNQTHAGIAFTLITTALLFVSIGVYAVQSYKAR